MTSITVFVRTDIDTGKRKDGYIVWNCGCEIKAKPEQRNLTVMRVGKENYRKCVCDCGKGTVVGQTELQNGETKSCGCLHRDRISENLKVIDGASVVIPESSRKGLRSNNTGSYTGVFHFPNGK